MAYELPFILYDNVLETGTVTVTSEESGFPKENMWDWLDWTYWKATSTATQYITIDKGAAGINSNTIAFLGHNFGSESVSGVIVEDDNPSFTSPTTIGSIGSPSDNDPYYVKFDSDSNTERYIRIELISGSLNAVFAAVVWVGERMIMPVGPEFSFDPDRQTVMSEKYTSYSGRMVSSAVKYTERDMNVPFRRIPQTFVASDLLPFLEDHYGAMKPFFFVPDPGDVFGTDKIYYLTAPDNPELNMSVYEDDIDYRNWTLVARGIRQSTFR